MNQHPSDATRSREAYVPPEQRPGLITPQQGNRISVRHLPNPVQGHATLSRPRPVDMPLLGELRLRASLGFEAMPSSMFWSFSTPAHLLMQVVRCSEDPLVNCVAVSLLSDENRSVAALVANQSGIGEPVLVQPGRYKIVAALGVAKEVAFELLFRCQPGVTLRGTLLAEAWMVLGRVEKPLQPQQGLVGLAPMTVALRGRLSTAGAVSGGGVAAPGGGVIAPGASGGLKGRARVVVSLHEPRGRSQRRRLHGTAAGRSLFRGRKLGHRLQLAPVRGGARMRGLGHGMARKVQSVHELRQNWRARVLKKGELVEINRAYLAIRGQPAQIAAALAELRAILDAQSDG